MKRQAPIRNRETLPPPVEVPLDNGGEFEENVEAMHHRAAELLGPHGNMIYPLGANVLPNIRVFNPRFGVVWYGDLDMIIRAAAFAKLTSLLPGDTLIVSE